MNQSLSIDIYISLKRKNFHAYSPAFPTCKAIGPTKKDALKNLSKKIGTYISKLTQENISKALNSNNFVEVVLDPEKENLEHYIYEIGNTGLTTQKKLSLKLSTLKKIVGDTQSDSPNQNESVEKISDLSEDIQNMMSETISQNPENVNVMTFGFPISLN